MLSNEDMNRELARDENEFKIFEEMDRCTLAHAHCCFVDCALPAVTCI